MKRTLVYLLLAVMLLLPVHRAKALEAIPEDMCIVSDGQFCLIASDMLMIYENDTVIEKIECPGAKFCDSLDGLIYVICQRGQDSMIEIYDASLENRGTIELGDQGRISEFAVNSSFFCMIYTDRISYCDTLYYYDRTSESIEAHEEFSMPRSLSANAECIAFLYDGYFGSELFVYYPSEDLKGIATDKNPEGTVLLRPDGDSCLLLHGNTTDLIEWTDGANKSSTIGMVGIGKSAALADTDDEGLYVFDTQTLKMTFYPYSDLSGLDDKILTIVDYSVAFNEPYLELVEEEFCRQHPGYRIEHKQYANLDTMRLELLSGDSSGDILYMFISNSATILKSGVFTDLRSFESIREIEGSDDYLKWPFHFSESPDGELYILPAYNGTSVWQINKALFDRLGLEKPDPTWTWDDFLILAREAKATDSSIYIINGVSPMFNEYLVKNVNIYTGEADFDTEEFRALSEIAKTLVDEELISNDFYAEFLFSIYSFFDTGKNSTQQLDTFITQPRFDSNAEAITEFDGYVMGIYSLSDEPETAADFISLYYSYGLEARENGNPINAAIPLFYADVDLYTGNGVGTLYYKNNEITSTAIKYAEHSTYIKGLTTLSHSIYVYWNDYLNDRCTLDSAIRSIQSMTDVWLNE